MNLATNPRRILVVDDDPLNLHLMARALASAGFTTTRAFNGAEALEHLDARKFDAVVSDVRMPCMDGLELLQRIRARFPLLPVILMTGLVEDDIRGAASTWGATALFQKPVDRTDLILTIRNIPHEPAQPSADFEFHSSAMAIVQT